METKKVWLVQSETCHDVYQKEEDARKAFLRIVGRLRRHKPNDSNLWIYKEIVFVDEYDAHYALFDGKCGSMQKDYHIFYCEMPVL